jgi:hypothetical protein
LRNILKSLFGWFLGLLGLILLVPSQLYAGYLVVELSELLVLFDVSGWLVGKGADELVYCQLAGGHLFVDLHYAPFCHHSVYRLLELKLGK